MDELPPELIPKRDEIHDRVVKRGRARRRQRRVVVVAAIVIAVGLPIAAVGLNAGDNGVHRVESVAPTTSPTVPTVPPPTITELACRNSTDPACGPFYYDPPLTNQPATLEVRVKPATERVGARVMFEIHAMDPDSFVGVGGDTFCGEESFGDGNTQRCGPSCAGYGPRHGPWSPPPARPSDATFTVEHTYAKSGTYTAEITLTADVCGPRPSKASASVTVHISP
jgi:hypothetical protein